MLVVVAGPTMYLSSVVADEDAFVAVADRVMAHPQVRSVVAEKVSEVTFDALGADEAVAGILPEGVRTFAVPITQIATTQLTAAAFRLLDTDIATQALDSGLREVHRQVLAEGDEVTVDLRAVLVRTSREIGGPTVGAGVAKFVSGKDTGRFVIAEAGSTNSTLLAVVRIIPAMGVFVATLALLALLAAILIANDRRRALITAGLVLATGAVATTIVVALVLFVVLSALAGRSSIGAAVAEVLTSDFAQQQRGAVLFGTVLAAIGLLIGNRASAIALRSIPGDLWHRRPQALDALAVAVADNPPIARIVVWVAGLFTMMMWSAPTLRVLVSIVLVVVVAQLFIWTATSATDVAQRWRSRLSLSPVPVTGHGHSRMRVNAAVITIMLLLLWPGWTRTTVVAFFVVGALVQALLDVSGARRLAAANAQAEAIGAPEPARRSRYAFAGAALVGVAAIGLVSTTSSAEIRPQSTTCNGHVELCDQRIDQLVFAGSHNAMSSNDLGWKLAMQDGDIVTQLDGGIRALLIDALYWRSTGTVEGGDDAAAEFLIESALSDDQPRSGTWLCHGFCALGATDLTGGLTDIDLWLDANPREVLLIVVQDEISEDDLTAAFEVSGLLDRVHVHLDGSSFPTLGELIDTDERVLVYAENGGAPDTWLQNAWTAAFTETPFTFALRSDFSCAPNRGETDNALFLINHWLTTGIPVREAAAAVNDRDALLARVNKCESERGRLPTVLATDFVETGDLIAVVDELNGVGPHAGSEPN